MNQNQNQSNKHQANNNANFKPRPKNTAVCRSQADSILSPSGQRVRLSLDIGAVESIISTRLVNSDVPIPILSTPTKYPGNSFLLYCCCTAKILQRRRSAEIRSCTFAVQQNVAAPLEQPLHQAYSIFPNSFNLIVFLIVF